MHFGALPFKVDIASSYSNYTWDCAPTLISHLQSQLNVKRLSVLKNEISFRSASRRMRASAYRFFENERINQTWVNLVFLACMFTVCVIGSIFRF